MIDAMFTEARPVKRDVKKTKDATVMEEIKDISPSALVLVVTAHGDDDTAVEPMKSSTRDYLEKLRIKNSLPTPESLDQPVIPPSTVTKSQHHKIEQAVHFINDNYRTDVCRDAASGKAGMSPSHFSRIFTKVMGVSYQEYLNGRRIGEAKDLLLTTSRSIKEIAAFLGFADQTGFGRIFKKLTGQTPSAYRSLPEK